MKKLIAILLTLVMVLSVAACGGKTEAPVATAENQKPAISGVQDASVEAGQVFDALAGVTASDAEDGDLTTMITVESTPTLDFKGGKATPENAGSYELVYSVTDKAGATAEAYATLTVTKKTGEATLLKEFDFTTAEATDAHGWEAVIDGADAAGALKDGAFVFDITNPGDGDGAVRFVKPGFAVQAGADYKIKVWAKSTAPTYAHFIAKNEAVEDWATFGSDVWNFRIDETMKPIEMNFTAPEDGVAELRLHLGKITPNPDNPADTTPENFTVTIDKVEIYEIVGQEVLEPLYTAEFAGSGAFVEAGDGAAASVAFEDGAAVFSIDAYPGEGGGVWSIRAVLELPGITIEQGEKYNYSFTIAAEHAQGGEALVESATKYHEARANFNGLGLGEGEEKVISSQFVAEASVEDPVIRMQIGNASEGVTTNKLTIKNFVFNKVGGDKETKKTIEAFAPFGMYAENVDTEKYPWQTFNGTDEDNEHGVGTIWTADGSLFYRIDDGGTVDWHNKLICPITLPSDSYFIVEIKAKADKPVSCGFFLNPQGGWDPRVSEGMDFTTEEQTFTFETKDIFITDMPCELLFQFGSEATAALGGVTVEFTSVTIYQMPVM